MDHIIVAFLAGSVLCLVMLGTGVLIGLKLGRTEGPNLLIAAPRTEERADRTDMQHMLAAWVDLRMRLMELALTIREMQQPPPRLLTQWRDEFTRLTDNVTHTLEEKIGSNKLAKEKTKKLTTSSSVTEEIGHTDLISNEQILDLLSQIGKSRDESAPLVRYKYAAKQFLAPAIDNAPLGPAAFSMVQCHDLSVRDIRYFVDQPPSDPRVVIGLGLPTPVKWVAAEIEDSRTAYRYGRVGYLVTARLLAAIDNRNHAMPAELPLPTDPVLA